MLNAVNFHQYLDAQREKDQTIGEVQQQLIFLGAKDRTKNWNTL